MRKNRKQNKNQKKTRKQNKNTYKLYVMFTERNIKLNYFFFL